MKCIRHHSKMMQPLNRCNGNCTGNCFFKLRYNLKAKFCRLFFRRGYGEFGLINAFPGKWWKIRDKNLESVS